MNRDQSASSLLNTGKNILNISENLSRLAVTQTQLKDQQLMLVEFSGVELQ